MLWLKGVPRTKFFCHLQMPIMGFSCLALTPTRDPKIIFGYLWASGSLTDLEYLPQETDQVLSDNFKQISSNRGILEKFMREC